MDGLLRDEVVVIQDQDDVLGTGRYLVEQHGEDRLRRRRLGCLEKLQHLLPQTGLHRLECGNQVRPEAGRIIVPLVQGKPRHPGRKTFRPLAEQGCFAKAGGRRNERQLAIQSRNQLLNQARAGHRLCPDRRHV